MCLFNKLALSEPHRGLIDAFEGSGNMPRAWTLKMQRLGRRALKRALSVFEQSKMTPLMSGLGWSFQLSLWVQILRVFIYSLDLFSTIQPQGNSVDTKSCCKLPHSSPLHGVPHHSPWWEKQGFAVAGNLPLQQLPHPIPYGASCWEKVGSEQPSAPPQPGSMHHRWPKCSL